MNIKKEECVDCKDLPEGEVIQGHDHRQFIIEPEEKSNNISKTYSEVAEEFLNENSKHGENIEIAIGVKDFATYLDSMPNLMPHMELMVMRKAREIDREMMVMMIAEIPAERVKEIAREVVERHKHTKTSIV